MRSNCGLTTVFLLVSPIICPWRARLVLSVSHATVATIMLRQQILLVFNQLVPVRLP